MREVAVKEITQLVRDLFIDANVNLGEDVVMAPRKRDFAKLNLHLDIFEQPGKRLGG